MSTTKYFPQNSVETVNGWNFWWIVGRVDKQTNNNNENFGKLINIWDIFYMKKKNSKIKITSMKIIHLYRIVHSSGIRKSSGLFRHPVNFLYTRHMALYNFPFVHAFNLYRIIVTIKYL